jgi:hypothetical protein
MSVIRGSVPPNLPNAPREYEQRYQDQFGNTLKLFFNTIASEINAPVGNASYYDTTTQTNPVGNAVNLFTYNNTVSEFQIRRGSPTSRIFVASTGLYNIQFSAQLDKTSGGSDTAYIWPRVNGQNVPDSATKIVIDGPNSEIVAAWNFLLPLNAGDYFELVWSAADTSVVILAEPATGNIPGIPSIILTMTYVSRIEVQ